MEANSHQSQSTLLKKKQSGYTLIELLAVIVVLAIILAIAIPSILSVIQKTNDRAIVADASRVLSGAKILLAEQEPHLYYDEENELGQISINQLQRHVSHVDFRDKETVTTEDSLVFFDFEEGVVSNLRLNRNVHNIGSLADFLHSSSEKEATETRILQYLDGMLHSD